MSDRMEGILSRAVRMITSFVSVVLELLFRYVCGGKNECIPPITDLLLLDSAAAIALKICSGKARSKAEGASSIHRVHQSVTGEVVVSSLGIIASGIRGLAKGKGNSSSRTFVGKPHFNISCCFKCETVVKAYISRIKDVEPFLNATSDTRCEAALTKASTIDKLIEAAPLTKPSSLQPLLGVPFTVVGSLAVKGMPHHCGVYDQRERKASCNATAVDLLERAGAIPVTVSNVPELCLGAETSSPIHGHTNNPYNLTRTPGGCSGGEAALLASAASVIGLGSDLMGEARMAAAFCGLFAHKPTAGLVSNLGHYLEFPAELDAFRCVVPMCRYASDLAVVLHVISGSNASALKLNDKISMRHIKWYFLSDCSSALASPSQRKAVQKVQPRKDVRQKRERIRPVRQSTCNDVLGFKHFVSFQQTSQSITQVADILVYA